MAGYLERHFRRQVKNDAPFDVALDENQCGNTFAAIRFLIHSQIDDLAGRRQRFREDCVSGVDKRLNEFHSHERCSPARAMGAFTALGSSLSTYRRISYSTSGLTGFCTKCLAPFCRAAKMFSW